MNDRNLDHLHPSLKPLCEQWLAKCHQQSIDVRLVYTYRSAAEQDTLYAIGRTKPGKIVTNLRGGKSKHNFTIIGKPASKAFDWFIQNPNGTANWDPKSPEWKAAVAIGESLGLTWGGNWKSLKDYDHFEIA